MSLGGDESTTGVARGSDRAGDAGGSRQLLAQWNPTSTDEERRAFYQQRLELFCRLFFWIFVIILAAAEALPYWVPSEKLSTYLQRAHKVRISACNSFANEVVLAGWAAEFTPAVFAPIVDQAKLSALRRHRALFG